MKKDGNALVMKLVTGAALKLDPWDGQTLTVTLGPTGPFALLAENLGPERTAFAQFQMEAAGRPNVLRLTANDGQTYELTREQGQAYTLWPLNHLSTRFKLAA